MTVVKAAAVLALWRDGRFDTFDIALAVSIHESDVMRVLDAARNRERGAAHLALV